MRLFVIAALATAFAAPAHAQQQSVAPKEFSREAPPPDSETARIETVRGDLAGAIGQWRGVRSCGDRKRVNDMMQAAFDRWIGQQTQAHPGKRLLTYGWGENSWSYHNGRRSSGARYCRGNFSKAAVYARFF